MTNYVQLLLSGIAVGSLYALIAIGYTMVYGILRLINFAHGDMFMMAGFFLIYIAAVPHMPIWGALILTILLTVLLGFMIERCAYKPLRSAPRMSVMISAIGVSYLLQNFATYFTGGLAQAYPAIPWISNKVEIFGVSTKIITIVTPIMTILLVLALVALIKFTKIGMAMRAVSKDFETARLMGIKVNSVISATTNTNYFNFTNRGSFFHFFVVCNNFIYKIHNILPFYIFIAIFSTLIGLDKSGLRYNRAFGETLSTGLSNLSLK